MNQISLSAKLIGNTRHETFLGREFVVVPAVLVRSQVLHNNLGITFLPPADVTPEWASNWNGIPVLVGPHPTVRGTHVTGRTPDLWNERCAGWIFNAKVATEDNGVRSLRGEVWLDQSRAADVDGLQAVLDKLNSGQPVELSTGFSGQLVREAGNFLGQPYEAIMHPVDADHLVISTEMTGACSVSDGCGLGVNRYAGAPPMANEADGQPGGSGDATVRPSLWERVKAKLTNQQQKIEESVESKIQLDEHASALNAMPVSDDEKRNRIRTALQEMVGDRGEVVVCDVYSGSEPSVVFWLITPLGAEPRGDLYFQCYYTEGGDGGYTFGEPERVRRVIGYEPAGNSTGEPSTQTATNCNCAPKEDTMADQNKNESQEQLAAIASSIEKLTQSFGNLAKDVADLKEQAKTDPNPAIAGLKKTIGELASTVNSMKGITETAVQERERERQTLVQELAGHFRVPFTAAELEAKPIDELRKLAEMAKGNDYSGRGGPRSAGNTDSEQRFVEPVPYWMIDKNDSKVGK